MFRFTPSLRLLLPLLVVLTAAACSTVSKNPYLRAPADFEPESQDMWTRPVELGYEFKGRVEGDASVTKVFGITIAGDSPAGTNVIGLITGMAKGDEVKIENPLIRHAAAKAIDDSKADGLYVLRAEVYETGLWPLFSQETAKVRGISLVLKDLGLVDKERADKERYLRAAPAPLVRIQE